MRQIKNPWLNLEGYNCFGCCPTNAHGVKMHFYEDGEEIVCFGSHRMIISHGSIRCMVEYSRCCWMKFVVG